MSLKDFCRIGLSRMRVVALVAATATLAACGGGHREATFAPTRIVNFGDENSYIAPDSTKYTVNAVNTANTPPTVDCNGNPIWSQILAAHYFQGVTNCNPYAATGGGARGISYAQPNASVSSIQGQVATYLSTVGAFSSTDLVSIWVGQKDILDIYALYPSITADDATARAEAAGAALGTQVNLIANAGAKVLIATVPPIGRSPFAYSEQTKFNDSGRPILLQQMTDRFNARLRATIVNDGRKIGLVAVDELIGTLLAAPTLYGYADVFNPACDAAHPLPGNCTTVDNGLATPSLWLTFLWADPTHLNADAHNRIGALAVTRAANNPF